MNSRRFNTAGENSEPQITQMTQISQIKNLVARRPAAAINSFSSRADMTTISPSVESSIPLARQLEVYQQGLIKLLEFHRNQIEPYVDSQIRLSNFPADYSKDSALTGTYYRMYLWVQTLSIFKTYNHFQAAAAGARTLFELLVDLIILEADTTDEQIERFHLFTQLEIVKCAAVIGEVTKKYRDQPSYLLGGKDFRHTELDLSFVNQVHQSAKKLWISKKGKPSDPPHWSGKNLKDRVNDLKDKKYAAWHDQAIKMLSWNIHPGAAVYHGRNEQDLLNSLGLSVHLARIFFVEGIRIFAKYMKIGQGVDNFYEKLDEVEAYPRMTLHKEELELRNKANNK